jgi:hypothetical protein
MYKLTPMIYDEISKTSLQKSVQRLNDGVYIPFDEANTDYQQFKQDIANGVELQNAEGQIMTKADITEFMRSLP